MIQPALKVWRDVTEKLLAYTEQTAEEQRDEAIAGIEKCFDDRDKLQSIIVVPYTPEEEAFGKELVVMEAEVQKKLVLFQKLIRSNISGAQSKKGTMKNYINPYSNVGRGGAYYDTKQ